MAKPGQGPIDPRRLVFIDETWTKTNMTRLRGWPRESAWSTRKFPQGKLGDDASFPRRLAQRPHRRALPVRRAHRGGRRALPRLCRTVPCPDAEARRRRDPRQSRLPQAERFLRATTSGDPQCRGSASSPAEIARPTCNPIEQVRQFKTLVCERLEQRTPRGLDACGEILAHPPAECAAYLKNAGYA